MSLRVPQEGPCVLCGAEMMHAASTADLLVQTSNSFPVELLGLFNTADLLNFVY